MCYFRGLIAVVYFHCRAFSYCAVFTSDWVLVAFTGAWNVLSVCWTSVPTWTTWPGAAVRRRRGRRRRRLTVTGVVRTRQVPVRGTISSHRQQRTCHHGRLPCRIPCWSAPVIISSNRNSATNGAVAWWQQWRCLFTLTPKRVLRYMIIALMCTKWRFLGLPNSTRKQ